MDTYPRGNILIFGGNGFMGAATVRALYEHHFNIAIVNRGNWYWDAEEFVKPYVHHIVCDRLADDMEKSCPELVDYVRTTGRFRAILDFSCYNGQAMENSLQLLHGLTDLYIYISSDSVYEISERDYEGFSREGEIKLPTNPQLLEILKQADDYAWGKIEGELRLEEYSQEKGLKYVALRLPDVVGPRDNFEDRWFAYFLWLRFSAELRKPVMIPDRFVNAQMSLVYVEDVGKIIGEIIEMGPSKLSKYYNLAFRERFTLLEVLDTMRSEMEISSVKYALDQKNEYYLFLPSVKLGPVNITKASKELNWLPTSVKSAIHETVLFFEMAMKRGAVEPAFMKQRKRVVEKLKKEVFQGQEQELDEAIDSTYGPYKTTKEEL